MDNMLSSAHTLRVSFGPTSPSDSDELQRKLTAISRFYTSLKRALLPSNDHSGRSTKRRKVLTDMPREGNLSPSRRSPPPTKSSQGASDKNSSVSAREKPAKSPARDGKQGRDRSVKAPSVAVAPSSTGLPSRGAPSHQTASRVGASPVASRLRMNSPETSAFVQARICQRRVELINKLMAVIAPFIDRTLDTLEAAYDGGGGNQPGRAGTKRGSGLVSPSASNSGLSMGQKRGNSNQSHESDGENDGDQRTGGRITKRTKTTERNKKFACPYYKHDPIKHAHTRTCSGPGWDEIHRVKEHVYRRHELPKFRCNRCYDYFRDERDLEDHQRMDVPCIVRERGAMDYDQGFDERQKMLLKSGKKSKLTEIERWKEIYSILFCIPIDSPEMPSPFYDDSDVTRAEKATVITSNDFDAYMSYCRREAPKAVRQALENEVDRHYGIIEDSMKSSMVRVVETSILNLWTTFQSIKPAEEVSTMPDPNSPAAARDTNGSGSPSPNLAIPHDVTSLVQTVFSEDLNFGLDLDLEGFYPVDSFQPHEQSSLCHQSYEADSGYRTYSDGSNNSDPSELLVNPVYDSRRGLRY